MSKSPRVTGQPVVDVILGVAATALGAIAYLELSLCGSGTSLILFGIALLFVGVAIFPRGGPTILAMAGFIAFLLVVVGLVLSHGVAGCF